MREIARDDRIELIAEEYSADFNELNTLAKQVTIESGIPYTTVDMTTAERQAAGIYERLCIRPAVNFNPNTGELRERHLYLRHADGVREEFWLDKIEARGTDGRVLIVCGHLHLDPLTKRAEIRGHRVKKRVYPIDLPTRVSFEVLD